jgi:ATP-dependent Clp protease ATP-binding subunit ClpB
MVQSVAKRLADRDITIEATPGALAAIARNSYDMVYGARPIKRYIQRNLETSIARELIQGNVSDGGKIIVQNQGNDVVIHYQPA